MKMDDLIIAVETRREFVREMVRYDPSLTFDEQLYFVSHEGDHMEACRDLGVPAYYMLRFDSNLDMSHRLVEASVIPLGRLTEKQWIHCLSAPDRPSPDDFAQIEMIREGMDA